MQKIRIGILGAADIAYRRFLPALRKTENFIFAGVAVASESGKARAQRIADEFGGRIYVGYENLLRERDIDAVYIPLPPSLHYTWADRALNMGKHVLSEKPCTMSLRDAEALVRLAEEKQLGIYQPVDNQRWPSLARQGRIRTKNISVSWLYKTIYR